MMPYFYANRIGRGLYIIAPAAFEWAAVLLMREGGEFYISFSEAKRNDEEMRMERERRSQVRLQYRKPITVCEM